MQIKSRLAANRRLTICFALAGIAMAGCAPVSAPQAVPPYAAPQSGPTATLVVRVIHPGGRFIVSSFEQPVACSRRRQLTGASATEQGLQSFTLSANRLQTLSFIHERNKQACEVIVSFEPRNGNTYLMRNTATVSGCSVELFNTTSSQGAVPERSLLRRERVGMGLADNGCKPLTSTVQPRIGSGPERPDVLEPFMDLLPGK